MITTTGTALAAATTGPSWTEVLGALAGVGTLIVAIWALVYARGQLREAQRLRREQAQPYVVAFMESSAVSPHLIDLVVHNYGTTAARDVSLVVDPTLQRSPQTAGGPAQDVWLPTVIPLLVPGQSWRTLWDHSASRRAAGLPDRHELTITYLDSTDTTHTSLAILDWNAFWGRRWVDEKTLHHAAKSLDAMTKTMSKWTEDLHGGLAVFTRDGTAKDQRQQEAFDEFERRIDTDHPIDLDTLVDLDAADEVAGTGTGTPAEADARKNMDAGDNDGTADGQ